MNIIIINYYFICNETHTHPQNTHTPTHTKKTVNSDDNKSKLGNRSFLRCLPFSIRAAAAAAAL